MDRLPILKVPFDSVMVPSFETAPETVAPAVPLIVNAPWLVKLPVESVVAPAVMLPEFVSAFATVRVNAPAAIVPVAELVRLAADSDPFASEKSASFTTAPDTVTLAVPFKLKCP